MRYLIIIVTATMILSTYAFSTAKENIHLPDSCVYYAPVYDADSFKNFDKKREKLEQWTIEGTTHVLSVLDSFKLLNHASHTIVEAFFEPFNCQPFSFLKTSKGTVLECYSRCEPSSYTFSPGPVDFEFCFVKNPVERFGPGVIDHPDSVLLSIIYRWDLDTVADFFRYGMAKRFSLNAFRYILHDNAVVDIQRFMGLNQLYGRIVVNCPW